MSTPFEEREKEKLAPLPGIKTDGEIERARDKTREIITLWLVGLLCAVVAFSFVGFFLDSSKSGTEEYFKNLKSLLDVLVGPILTLLSTAIGFYFGSQAGRGTNPRATDGSDQK